MIRKTCNMFVKTTLFIYIDFKLLAKLTIKHERGLKM